MAIKRITCDVLPTALIEFRIVDGCITDRRSTRPNSNTRKVIRGSLSYNCSLCGLESDWSKDAPQHARLEIAHTIAAEIGGTWNAWNLTGQCFTCNRDAYFAGMQDLRAYVIVEYTIERFLPAKLVLSRNDVRDSPALSGLASEDDRRKARKERLGW